MIKSPEPLGNSSSVKVTWKTAGQISMKCERKASLEGIQITSKLPDVLVDENQTPLAWPTRIPHNLCGV